MKKSEEILSSVLKTTQMGQIGIRSALEAEITPDLRSALQSQLKEYDSIEQEAHAIASQRGWKVSELNPSVRFMTDRMTRIQLTGKDPNVKIADMMIMGNTKGMIKGMKVNHQFIGQDERVNQLSQKLLETEHANIRQMEPFL